ncbi:hypothetical protein ACFQU7_33740 [Pseudoroseomonas wenyumeiae]
MDAEGFLFITGRASDMYISGGSNVYPREVEEKILAFPGIVECAVLGVPDPLWGETGIAVVVPQAGAQVDSAALLAFLGERLSRYKLPRHVFVQEALPKSGYGKITKALVRQDLEARGLLPCPPRHGTRWPDAPAAAAGPAAAERLTIQAGSWRGSASCWRPA